MIEHVYNDGGREAAGFRGKTGDCVTRAIAIAAELPYREVYDELFERGRTFWAPKVRKQVKQGEISSANAQRRLTYLATPRNGILKTIYEPLIEELGFVWTATMQIGGGCQVHLRADELPSGRIIARCSRHVTAVIDGVLHDTHDSSRGGSRCVYGFYER